jgi:hypothetical protein
MKIDDAQLRSICEAEIRSATGYGDGELSRDRATAMNRYLGQPRGDEIEGRSQLVTREILDAVEWIKPSLMRIFANADNIVEFEPVGPEDEEQARLESDFISHAFWEKNKGFYNLLTFITDGLLGKVGCLKMTWEDGAEEVETYTNLDPFELSQLVNDPEYARDLIDVDEESGELRFSCKPRYGCLVIDPCPPEETGVNRDMRSPFPQDATFFYQRSRKTKSELLGAGFDKDKVEALPWGNDVDTSERLARRDKSDEQEALRYGAHESMRSIWITECYVRIDRNEDGYAELLKVTLGGNDGSQSAGGVLLDVEDVDKIPFYTFSPILLSHKFHGLSVADLLLDIEETQTALLRNQMDNVYLTNNQRQVANENVEIDDLLTNRPGGIVRTKGKGPVGNDIAPLITGQMDPNIWKLQESMDARKRQRTGVGDEVAALDVKSMGEMNTGVASLMFDAARSKVELIARIVAEIGLRPLFEDARELYAKNFKGETTRQVRGQWVTVNPSDWKRRQDVTVTVGLGHASTERRLMALSDTIQKQQLAVESGGMGLLVTPENIHAALTDYTELLGLQAGKYWMDPATAQPKPAEGPDPALLIQQQAVEAQRQRNDVEMYKADLNKQVKEMEAQMRMAESEAKQESEHLREQLKFMESRAKAAEGEAKLQLDAEIAQKQIEIDMAKVTLESQSDQMQRELDMWKTMVEMKMMNGGGAFDEVQGRMVDIAQATQAAMQEMSQSHAEETRGLYETIVSLKEEANAPRRFTRDASGLVAFVNDKPVHRDESGRVIGVG